MHNATYIERFFAELTEVVGQIDRTAVADAIDMLLEVWQNAGTVFIAGNGGSAATASHFACDLAKWTTVQGQPRFRVMALTDNLPLYSALVNDEGPASVFAEQLEPFIGPGDVLILISVHGGSGAGHAGAWSQNLLRALAVARDHGARVIGMSGFDGGALLEMADTCILVPVHSTPQVESLHLAIEHLICDCLREEITARSQQGG